MKKLTFTILSLLISANLLAASFEELTVHRSEMVADKPIVEYANIWWQWTYSMPKSVSPVRDITGENCHQSQNGDVWFLAGGYGTSKIKRRCEIPDGKHIFFPVINMVYWNPSNGSLSCEQVKELAALNNDEFINLDIEVDGIQAYNPIDTRMASLKCFDLLGLVPKEMNPPKVFPTASDGYWVMLKPLAKGKHSIKFQAKYNRGEKKSYGEMAQDIEYEIMVK